MRTKKTNNLDSGATYKVVPLLLVCALPLFTIMDCWTTYLVTPDLVNEWNPLVRFFGLGWNALIIQAIFIICFVIICSRLANKEFSKQNTPKCLSVKTICLAISVCCIYIYAVSVPFAVVNNTLNLIELKGSNIVYIEHVAISYVRFYQQYIEWFFDVIVSLLSIFGIIVAVLRLRRASNLRNNAPTFSTRNN